MSKNEWGQLKKVIVGIADNAKIPIDIDISLRCVNFADKTDESEIQKGSYPQQVIDEANEDLEVFVNFLKGEYSLPNKVQKAFKLYQNSF